MNNPPIGMLMEEIAIFDIDGCISDDAWRLPRIAKSGPNRFHPYHVVAGDDDVLHHGREHLLKHIRFPHSIVFITARPTSVWEITKRWIDKTFPQFGNTPYIFMMRGEEEEGLGSVEIKLRRLRELSSVLLDNQSIVAAYDDRPDVIKMYLDQGIDGARILDKDGVREYAGQETVISYAENVATKEKTAADILDRAAATFRERNAVYKDNAEVVGKVMEALFPDGVQVRTAADHKMYHLFELIIVKLTRFTQSGLTHPDSIHDLAVYAAMCENLVRTHDIKSN